MLSQILIYYWHEKADSEASAKWKEVKGKPHKINELILKTKFSAKEYAKLSEKLTFLIPWYAHIRNVNKC